MRGILLSLLFVIMLWRENPFTGRWALYSNDGLQAKIFWLEIVNGPQISGSFFGATGGRLATIRDAQVR
jgi:hypothetical protein